MNLLTLDNMLIISACLIGVLLGWLISAVRHQQSRFRLESELKLSQQESQQRQQVIERLSGQSGVQQASLSESQAECHRLHTQLVTVQERLEQQIASRNEWREECEKLNQELRMLREVNSSQEAEIRELTIRLEETRLSAEEKQRLLVNSEQRLNTQFENLANRIFEQSSQRADRQNKQSLDGLLTPLREQLDSFRKQVQDSFGQESKERHTLTHEIRNLQQLNARMAQEAVNLTNALKGDNKTQGNWGEVVLSKVLEASGLREGYEYHTQVNIMNERGERQQPDVIVHLPQDKDVIVDAKMSLVAYERYFNHSDDPSVQQQALNEHIASIRNHIRQLGRKDYQTLPNVRSLDYILMFIPVEPAFLLAIERQPELINEALQNNIMLVSPTTLLVALRTINNLWRYEYQSQNAKEIAVRAGRLYDKVRLFIDDMLAIGHSLDKAQNNYQQALNKLSQGRGNIVGQVESFRSMGIDVKKIIAPIPANSGLVNGNDGQRPHFKVEPEAKQEYDNTKEVYD
jgi:DNA recombination protein RmuC